MNKVKITQEQAEAILDLEDEWDDHTLIKKKLTNPYWFIGSHEIIRKIDDLDFIDVLRIGYEVIKPKFKIEDWVTHENGAVSKITNIDNRGIITTDHRLNDGGSPYMNTLDIYFRYSTPEEITKEKERRWWDKHNRDVWELNLYDCVIDENGKPFFIDCVNHDHTENSTRYELNDGANFPKGAMKHYFKVLYFIKDRKDV